jgi:aspartate 1-decarboxylase
MQIEVVKSKIHRVKVTGADLDYVGSITLDDDLMAAAGISTGSVVLNGPAARRVQKGDVIIIIAYGQMTPEEAKTFKPQIVFPNESTNLLK